MRCVRDAELSHAVLAPFPARSLGLVHAARLGRPRLCAVGRATLPGGVRPLRLREPAGPQGRRDPAGERPAHVHVRQVQPVHHQGQRARVPGGPAVRHAAHPLAGRDRHGLRPAGRGRGDGGRRPVRHLPPAARGALSQRQAGAGAGCEAQLRHPGRPLRHARLQDPAGRRGGRGRGGCAHRALPPARAQPVGRSATRYGQSASSRRTRSRMRCAKKPAPASSSVGMCSGRARPRRSSTSAGASGAAARSAVAVPSASVQARASLMARGTGRSCARRGRG